jgi:hypothetical protein
MGRRRRKGEEEGEKRKKKADCVARTEYVVLESYFALSGLRGRFSPPKTRLGLDTPIWGLQFGGYARDALSRQYVWMGREGGGRT